MATPTWITINVKNRSPAVQSHAIPAMRSDLRCYCAAGFRTRFCWCNFLFQLNFYNQQKTLHLYHVHELYLTGESGESSEFHGSNHISHKLSVRVLPLSVKLPKLKKARVSWPTTAAISCINIRSKVAAHDGPDGNEVEQRESGPSVQLEDIEEWMQLEPQ